MSDPFDLGDAVIRDLPHVRVTRHAPQGNRACEYRKVFNPEGLGDASYWSQRENEFLLDFTVKRLRHTVELSAFARGGEGTPVVEMVATRDAGITIEDWLKIQPRYDNGAVWQHPFQHAGQFLRLLRACLVALKEIHGLGIVHCDIKEDNICLPYSPYPYMPGQSVRIDFERVKLIDFAFSITPERPLRHPLPILPAAPYQSNLLKAALSGDRAGKSRGGLAAQRLDYRADLYSLGFLAGRILDAGLLQPAGAGGMAAMEGARGLTDRLKALDSGKRLSKTPPHEALIDEIDGLLEELVDQDAYGRFEVARVRESSALDVGAAPGDAGIAPTPLTPLATPLVAASPVQEEEEEDESQETPPKRSRWLPALLALALLAGLFGYWQTQKPPATPPLADKKPPTESLPKADGEAEKRAKLEAQWKKDAEAQYQAEEAKAKAEKAKAKAELAAELRAESAAQKPEATEPAEPPVEAARPGKAEAKIDYPADGDRVGRSEEIQGTQEGLDENQHAFLVIRSKAEAYGRLHYPQGELPHATDWAVKGVFATPNYDYEAFVVATENPQSAELLRSPKSRAYGLKSLPEGTRRISPIVTVTRLP